MIIGLTGGIGSGKSEVSRRFEQLGITVIDADIIAREVVALDSNALIAITEHFGQQILSQDKTLNRSKLRELIFDNNDEKIWLENLLHPIIRNETIAQLKNSKSPYAILSSPLLLETTQHELVDRVLVIDTSEELQLVRASARDASNTEQIRKIMATQMKRSERCNKAGDIIRNHGDLKELDLQIQNLHKQYLALAEQTKHS
jgi:dephospho-CoA kinase